LITNQTLEPTLVAGFNQFYDDADATDAWRYGAAIDQKVSSTLYGGAEFSYRDLQVPYNDVVAGILRNVDWSEYLGRAYLFWTPHKWVALRAGYQYERFQRDENFNLIGTKDMKTHSVPLGVSFFHPCGISASMQGTYYKQDGWFQRRGSDSYEKGSSDFWVVDAAINYRLPNRYGLVSFGVSNLFNKDFSYQETDLNSPRVQPERLIYGQISLALP
jgi:outer membrane receptor for ferrienterochelin and colicin